MQGILYRTAFSQELGVHAEPEAWPGLLLRRLLERWTQDAVRRPGGNGRLNDDDLVAFARAQCTAHSLGGFPHVSQIDGSVLPRRCSNAQEHGFRLARGTLHVGCEGESTCPEGPSERLRQLRLVVRRLSRPEVVNDLSVDVSANDLVAPLCESDGGREADVARPDDRNMRHRAEKSLLGLRARRPGIDRTTWSTRSTSP